MTAPLWCLFAGCLIPYVLAGVGGYLKSQELGTLDNAHPRGQATLLQDGPAARAGAAQANAWEGLAVFGAAVIANHLFGGDPGTASTLAFVWLAARLAHAAAYVANVPPLRSGVFLVALVCSLWLFLSPVL